MGTMVLAPTYLAGAVVHRTIGYAPVGYETIGVATIPAAIPTIYGGVYEPVYPAAYGYVCTTLGLSNPTLPSLCLPTYLNAHTHTVLLKSEKMMTVLNRKQTEYLR